MIKFLLSFSLFAGFVTGSIARADSTYSYNYYGVGISGSGQTTITTTDTDGVYLVTSITGTVNGLTVQGLLPANSYMGNDNLFYDGDAYLDTGGVSFETTDGADVNIYYDGSDYYFQGDSTFQLDGGTAPQPATAGLFHALSTSTPIPLESFTFAPLTADAATPEPSSVALLGTGVLGLAGVIRRRFVKA